MNEFVVVIKFFGELKRDGSNDTIHELWPAECREFESREIAQEACPGRHVMTFAEYKFFQEALGRAINALPKKTKSKWKFWGK